jgi:hypothetical protein
MTLGYRARAELEGASKPFHRAKVDWTLSPLLDKAGNSVKGNWSLSISRSSWAWISLFSNPAALKIGCDNRRGNRDCEREGSTREWRFAIYVQGKTCFRPSLSHVPHEYFAS